MNTKEIEELDRIIGEYRYAANSMKAVNKATRLQELFQYSQQENEGNKLIAIKRGDAINELQQEIERLTSLLHDQDEQVNSWQILHEKDQARIKELENLQRITTDLLRQIRREQLAEHFEQTRITDPIQEVTELLTGYNNMMAGFDRKQIAELMIVKLSDNNKESLDELVTEFIKL